MAELFASGRLIDLILVLVGVEFLGLLALRRWRGRGPGPLDLACALGAGVFLLLAVRSALVGAPWPWTAGCLGASLLAHLADLWRRTALGLPEGGRRPRRQATPRRSAPP